MSDMLQDLVAMSSPARISQPALPCLDAVHPVLVHCSAVQALAMQVPLQVLDLTPVIGTPCSDQSCIFVVKITPRCTELFLLSCTSISKREFGHSSLQSDHIHVQKFTSRLF